VSTRAFRRPSRGFTLIEVLIAATIGATVVVLTAHVFHVAMQARNRLQVRTAGLIQLRRAYDIIARDVHSAINPPAESETPFGFITTPSGRSALQFATTVGDPMLVSRSANETVFVEYVIDDDPDTGIPTLFRFETPYPPADTSQAGMSGDPDMRITPLLRGVTDATFLFYSTDQQNWLETWDSQAGMPTAIRLDFLQRDLDANGNQEPHHESWTFSLPGVKFQMEQDAKEAQEAEAAATDTGGTEP
jgi:prepilin-type N-terminal cleavage/methylation domain-containing protein